MSKLNALVQMFREWRGDANTLCIACAPGRVNLIGEHTDYNDGFVLPMTLQHAVYVAARSRKDTHHHLLSEQFGEEITFPSGILPDVPRAHWATYVGGMLIELQRLHQKSEGFDMLISGDVPPGAGLSSSAALEMAVGIAVEEMTGITMLPAEMARIGQHVEHKYVGVQCGIMDQMASRLGKKGHALFIDCRTAHWEHIPIPVQTASIVIVDSGVRRKLAASKYNERRTECTQALKILQTIDPQMRALRDVTAAMLQKYERRMPRIPHKRAQHVVDENLRVQKAVTLLQQGNSAGFGSCMFQSHASLQNLYDVSCRELDFLVTTASTLPGVLGARMTGGGFGGCTVNLVTNATSAAFCEQILHHYRRAYDHTARTIVINNNIESGIIFYASSS